MTLKKPLRILINALFLIVVLPGRWANGAIEQPHKLEAISSISVADIPLDMAVLGSYAYLAAGEKGLLVVDIANPATPKIVHAVDTPGNAAAVAVAGDYAYIADTEGGLLVLDISEPAAAFIVASVTDAGTLVKVAVSDSYAYAADTTGALQVIDVSSSHEPKTIARCSSPDGSPIFCVAVKFPYAYVTYGYPTGLPNNGGLSVIDISDPSAPKPISLIKTRRIGNDIRFLGGYAFIAGGDLRTGGLEIIDISDPRSPRLAGYVDCPSVAGSLEISGKYAFVTCGDLLIIDISNTFSPFILDVIPVKGFTRGVALTNELLLVSTFNIATGEKNGGIQVMAESDIVRISVSPVFAEPAPVPASSIAARRASHPLPFSPVAVSGYVVCASQAGTNGKVLQVLDLTGSNRGLTETLVPLFNRKSKVESQTSRLPAAPATVELPSEAKDIAIWRNLALVAGDKLYKVDLSNPARPALLGSVKGIEDPYSVDIFDSYAYVVNGYGLRILNLKSPDLDEIVGSVDTPYSARDVAISGKIACVADGAGLQLIDVSDKKRPKLAGSFAYEWAMALHVAVKGKFAYLSDRTGFITVVDISDISNPFSAGTLLLSGPIGAMSVSGSRLYVPVCAESTVLEMLDLGVPEKPKIIAKMGRPGTNFSGRAVATSGSKIFVNEAGEGLLTGAQAGSSQNQAHIGSDPPALLISCESGLSGNAKFKLCNSGSAPLSFSICSDVEWLKIKPSIGGIQERGKTLITVSLIPHILPEGTHKARLTVAGPDADNSPLGIEVTVDVTSPIYRPIEVEPKTLYLQEIRGGVPATVTLTSEAPFKILKTSASFKWIEVEKDSEKESLEHIISIRINKDDPGGKYGCTINVFTDNPAYKEIIIPFKFSFAEDTYF